MTCKQFRDGHTSATLHTRIYIEAVLSGERDAVGSRRLGVNERGGCKGID